MRTLLMSALVFSVLTSATISEAFNIKGGPIWQKRTGWGMTAGVGSLYCGEEICDDNRLWDTNFFGSIEGSIGGYNRFIPNLSAFFELRTAHINTSTRAAHDDSGFLFEMAGGADFHVPIFDWLDVWTGAGIGFVHLGFKADLDDAGINDDWRHSLNGILFEFRTGADVYLFTQAPTLGLGLYMRWGLPLWLGMCYERGVVNECQERGDFDDFRDLGFDSDDTPWFYHLGARISYGF